MSSIAIRQRMGSWPSPGTSDEATQVFKSYKVALRHFQEPISQEPLVQRFANLAETWKSQTRLMSSSHQLAMNHAYQEIIGMGKTAIPYILADMKVAPSHWFWALAAISGENPVPLESQGSVPLMTKAWLEWGRSKGLVA